MIIMHLLLSLSIRQKARNNKNMKYDEPEISIFKVAFEQRNQY